MCNTNLMIVLVILAFNLAVSADSGLETPQTRSGLRKRPQRDVSCRDHHEYPRDDICCLNCPAGTYVKSACASAHGRSTCENCDFDTYTEHSNGLSKCFKCTKCRPDQETVARCTSMLDTECQCTAEHFCPPDQACEVCRKCTKCKDDEEKVRNCTSVSNTECKKRASTSSSKTATISAVAVTGVLVLLAVPVVAAVLKRNKKLIGKEQDSQNTSEMDTVVVDSMSSLSDAELQNKLNCKLDDSLLRPLLMPAQAEGQQTLANQEKDNTQGNSFPSTPHSSLASQPSVPSTPLQAPYPHPCPAYMSHPNARVDTLPQRKLVPLNGDKSLTDCFSYFEELDVRYHNRFFRHIGVHENAIKSRENLLPEDRVHELLTVWREKAGMKASINDLIGALLHLNQRLSAENVVAKAISGGHFEYGADPTHDESQCWGTPATRSGLMSNP